MSKPATPRLRVRRRTPPAKAPIQYRNLVLAALVLLAGAGTSLLGYQFGQKALEDVTTPEPIVGGETRKPLGKTRGLMKEDQILATLATLPEASDAVNPEELLEQQEDLAAEDTSEAKLKITTARATDENVTVSVDSVAWQGNNLVLAVSLQNKSYRSARFVYSPAFDLLVITDDQGRPMRTFTEGLPTELPDDRETYRGTIQVSASDIQNAQSLSLSLTDYPDRELQFQISSIPVPAPTNR